MTLHELTRNEISDHGRNLTVDSKNQLLLGCGNAPEKKLLFKVYTEFNWIS
jgi:hypothetical protein